MEGRFALDNKDVEITVAPDGTVLEDSGKG
jgi:hypothetical protein